VAATGAGAWVNGRRARVSECDDLAAARLVTSGLEYWRDSSTDAHRAGFERLQKATRFARTWGDGFGYFLVATGRAELMCDPIAGDVLGHRAVPGPAHRGRRPLHPVRRHAGDPLEHALAGNPRLHAAAMRVLGA
jgi:fructose-1,6-bisphosphatase/inositol monophosphatase family enzyme